MNYRFEFTKPALSDGKEPESMRVTDAYGTRYVPVSPEILERAIALLGEGAEAEAVRRSLQHDLEERYDLPLPSRGPRYPWLP